VNPVPRIKKEFLGKLVSHINRKDWWHVPPLDPDAYRKRGKFLASSFAEAELYGRPLDTPQRVTIANPLVGDEPPSRTNGLDVRSAIRLDQIRTVDRQRLSNRLGVIDPSTMAKVNQAIRISLGLIDV
jgi:hypothetical protein